MSETKDEIAADRDRLQQELDTANARIAQLEQERPALAGPARPANPEPRFELSAGEQAELQTQGFTRSVRDSSVIVADDYPDLVDRDAMTDAARAANDREKQARERRAADTVREG
jgi:hypothetical protein